jgi:salicylate hydroxylase
VQRRSQRNGQIFHAVGAVRWARDVALRALGERIVDLPWLYGATGTEIGRST